MDAAVRASDADREAAVDRLRLGMGEGRLTVEELEDRLTAAYRAQTRDELDRLLIDLPPDAGLSRSGSGPATRMPVRPGGGGTRWLVSLMGGNDRRGHWRLAPRCLVVNVMGGTDLDLVDAELAADRVDLTVVSLMGGTRITVPDSLDVEVSKFALMAGHDVDLGRRPAGPGGPVLAVRYISIMGGGELRRAGGRAMRRGRRRSRIRQGPPPSGRLDR